MANFGYSRLTVVAPYLPHWREARSAVGAPELLRSAGEAATLEEAVVHCALVAGTGTVEHRKPQQRVVALPAFAPVAAETLAKAGKVALIFGPEKHGLTRDDLSFCHLLVEIPTDPRQPSMNLGQAVAVCLYELARSVPQFEKEFRTVPGRGSPPGASEPATSGSIGRLADVLEETMTASDYSPAGMRAANRLDLRELLRRLAFSESDATRALRFFRRVLQRLNRD